MADPVYESFQNLTSSEFAAYADNLVKKQRTSEKRKQLLTYLQTVNSLDNTTIEAERTSFTTKIRQNRLKDSKIKSLLSDHSFDFAKNTELFSAETLSGAQLTTLLTQNDAEVYINQDYTQDIVISGDDIVLSGEGNGLSARTEALVNTTTITGDIRVGAFVGTFSYPGIFVRR